MINTIKQKISNVIEGWLNVFRKVHPVKEALFRDRFQTCLTNECGMLKFGMCTACGCPIKSKTRSVDEECPENMWNPVMYEFEGIQFIDPYELPNEVYSKLVTWLVYKCDNVKVLETPCPMAIKWENWLEFKEYLKKL